MGTCEWQLKCDNLNWSVHSEKCQKTFLPLEQIVVVYSELHLLAARWHLLFPGFPIKKKKLQAVWQNCRTSSNNTFSTLTGRHLVGWSPWRLDIKLYLLPVSFWDCVIPHKGYGKQGWQIVFNSPIVLELMTNDLWEWILFGSTNLHHVWEWCNTDILVSTNYTRSSAHFETWAGFAMGWSHLHRLSIDCQINSSNNNLLEEWINF